MTCLTLATILHLPLVAASESYADAHRQTVETGRPMVVMVGAEWCPACKQMEATVIPQVRKRGLLARVAFALVDLDRDRELGHRLTAGGPIPQLIVFRKTADGWKNRRLIGCQSVQAVEEFINEDLAATDAKKKTPANADKKPAAKKVQPVAAEKQSPPQKAAVRQVSSE